MAQLAVALDFSSGEEALAMAKLLMPCSPWLKIGLELFTSAGPELVRTIKKLDFRVFLDLKFYDIPNTVAKAVAACCALNVDMLTLHLQGGQRMCEAALEAAAKFTSRPLLAGVTALTSFASGEMPGIAMEPGDFGLLLANKAQNWGLNAVVCSGHELAKIKKASPGLQCVCPGIRPANGAQDDQRRVMTPTDAVRQGADFLVIGRPITQSANPLQMTRDILAQMEIG